jgi:hypothetical protein
MDTFPRTNDGAYRTRGAILEIDSVPRGLGPNLPTSPLKNNC